MQNWFRIHLTQAEIKKEKSATILRYFPPLLFLPPWFFLLFVCFSFASVIFELIGRRKTLPFGPTALSLKNAMAAKCAIYGSFVKDRRDILRHSSTYQLNARYDFENTNKSKVLIVSSLGAEQVRFWKIKP